MAIFHQHHRHICRGKGRSATGAAAYRGALDITDARTGISFRYAKRGGVLDHAIIVPEKAPDWAHDPVALWNAAEAAERYKNARVGVEDIIALPHELSLEENRAWLHGFVQAACVSKGQAVQVDIHAPDKKGDHRNIHAHILCTTRVLDQEGFGEKAPLEWSDKRRAQHGLPKAKVELKALRALCAKHMNRALERAGHKACVDHRSFKDRGIDRKPARHLGPAATQMERKGQKTRIGDENRAVQEFNRLKWQARIIDLQIAQARRRVAAQKQNRPVCVMDRKKRYVRPEQVKGRIRKQRVVLKEEALKRKRLRVHRDSQKTLACQSAPEMRQHYNKQVVWHGKADRANDNQSTAKMAPSQKPPTSPYRGEEKRAVSECPKTIQASVRACEAFSACNGKRERHGYDPPVFSSLPITHNGPALIP